MNDDCQLSAHRFGGRPGGRLVFGLASLTSLMSRCSALLTVNRFNKMSSCERKMKFISYTSMKKLYE